MRCIVASYVSTAITAWGGTSKGRDACSKISPLALKRGVILTCQGKTFSLKFDLFWICFVTQWRINLMLYSCHGIHSRDGQIREFLSTNDSVPLYTMKLVAWTLNILCIENITLHLGLFLAGTTILGFLSKHSFINNCQV